jgi:hypothetical protein
MHPEITLTFQGNRPRSSSCLPALGILQGSVAEISIRIFSNRFFLGKVWLMMRAPCPD